MIIKDYGFDDPQKRKETLELIKKVVDDHKNNLKLELTVKALSMIGMLVEKQEQIIEDLEERVAIMEDDGWHKITENADSYPKESKEIDVWICCEDENGNREVFKAVYYVKHFYDCAGWLYTENNGWKITHWKYRKFPEPPKGEET